VLSEPPLDISQVLELLCAVQGNAIFEDGLFNGDHALLSLAGDTCYNAHSHPPLLFLITLLPFFVL